MKLLLDTNVVLWLFTDRSALSRELLEMLADEANALFVSVLTAYELAWKNRAGKLPEATELLAGYDVFLGQAGITQIALEPGEALIAAALPGSHRDPFDRMIAGQAIALGMAVASADSAFDSLGVQRYW